MNFYSESEEKVIGALRSSPNGLTTAEAYARLAVDGKNKIKDSKKKGFILRLFEQMSDPMTIVLIAAAVVSAFTSAYAGESFADVWIILFVVILNAVLGLFQESKAEKAIESLKEMTSSSCRVLRDGKVKTIKNENVVCGDVVVLEAGDAVPADIRITESMSLRAEESALTGESTAVDKSTGALKESASLGDRRNMLYLGSTIVYGRGKGIVCGVGMNTEMGKIASVLSDAKEEKTPLQVKLSQLSKILTFAVVGICVVMFTVGILRSNSFSAETILSNFMIAVSLAVAAIPEGLAAVVTIVLSMGVMKMSEKNAVVRRLTAVETLGCAKVICSDKTGTLTQNKMTVADVYGADRTFLALAAALCCDTERSGKKIVGEPTECAIVNYAESLGVIDSNIKNDYVRIGEIPFDSSRKMMTTFYDTPKGKVQYTKGAPDEIASKCSFIYDNKIVRVIKDSDRRRIASENRKMAEKALRVIGVAFVNNADVKEEANAAEKDMTFIGLIGMTDPVRPEVANAIRECRNAGINVVMITGDHIDTAVAIASELGIIQRKNQATDGVHLDMMSDEELAEHINDFRVFARVRPEHKVRIVNAWKKLGAVTAMTGDGVNDAPSIKSADIGIGMGISGTDVTKSVSDMILADDNFATIVVAVEEGRRIYANIRKAIQFLLSSNLSEVISIFTATILGFTILRPVHILWINLITDSLPALALGMENGEADAMKTAPRDSKKGIFADGVAIDVMYQGICVALLTLASYFAGQFSECGHLDVVSSDKGMTMAFFVMSMAEIFQAFNMRSLRGSIFRMKTYNMWLVFAAAGALCLTSAVIYLPSLRGIFGLVPLSLAEYIFALSVSALIIPIVEAIKFIQRKLKRDE